MALIIMANASPVRLRPLHWVMFGLLLLWAIPFPLQIQIPKFGVFEDGIMVAAGLFAPAARIVPDRRVCGTAPDPGHPIACSVENPSRKRNRNSPLGGNSNYFPHKEEIFWEVKTTIS